MMLDQQVLTPAEFVLFQKLMYERTGIYLKEAKMSLVANRLRARLRELTLPSYQAYYEYVLRHGDELTACIDAITTNETYFFREPRQWEYFASDMLPELVQRNGKTRTLKIWSAASSTGEEPYTIAIFLKEHLPAGWTSSIIASDINSQVLQRARTGIYRPYAVNKTDAALVRKYFAVKKLTGKDRLPIDHALPAGEEYHLDPAVRAMVQFKTHNLKDRYPLTRFDMIFCRNVLIYFNDESKRLVLQNLYESLVPNGYLLLGAAEGMMGMNLKFRTLRPSIYQRVE
ncbi:MAG TPA: protein-glutamate O-methyltransferase CheR [bacterium]|mgnify:CR=1 FL=1|nr:protein-glutamate O-methyltransferase CheR [bacterium]